MRSALRTVVALVPCVAALLLLARFVPLMAEAPLIMGPRAALRLDPLVLAGWLILGLCTARPGKTLLRTLRVSIGAMLVGLALAAAAPTLSLLLIYLASLLLLGGIGPGWLLAVGALSLANLEVLTQTTGLARPMLPALVCAGLSGCGGLPWPARWLDGNDFEVALRPFWLLVLLRSLELEPWPLVWTLFVPLVGIVAAAGVALQAVAAPERERVAERLLAAVLLWALACVGVNTMLGVVAALWVMLAHALLLVWLWSREAASRLVIGCSLFVAAWWTVVALAGAKAFLLAGVVWLTGATVTWTLLVWLGSPATKTDRVSRRTWRSVAVATGAVALASLVLFSGMLTQSAGLPIADQLDAGLTAFGLVDTWSWIGVGALDAARRRIGLLPVVQLVLLWAVTVAITWLVARLAGWRMHVPPLLRSQADGSLSLLPVPADQASEIRRGIRSRIWWIDLGRDG